jgi:hypothetical protein
LKIGFKVVPDDSLYFFGVCCYVPHFVSDFVNLGLSPHHFSQICQGFMSVIYFFKEPAFCFVDSFYGFLVSISLISAIIFIISLLLLILGLACSYFSRSFRDSIKLFI